MELPYGKLGLFFWDIKIQGMNIGQPQHLLLYDPSELPAATSVCRLEEMEDPKRRCVPSFSPRT